MDELRFVRREDLSLIVANDADQEFRVVVDDAVLSELRHLSKRERVAPKVRPREIQSLIRGGLSLAQAAKTTGLEESDIERYAEPVLAERNYVLERAHAVAVRTDVTDAVDQQFGEVIAERLVVLGTDTSEWSAWKDEDAGWLIGLEFISQDVAHQAVWSFDHRKSLLSPTNTDAVNLSKQGSVGDRLIPKLRAVDAGEPTQQFGSEVFAAEADSAQDERTVTPAGSASTLTSAAGDTASTPASSADRAGSTEAGSQLGATPTPEPLDVNAEYERRREIDQRAIKTSEGAQADLSQTADLLDALRKRRGERDRSRESLREAVAAAGPAASSDDSPSGAESLADDQAPHASRNASDGAPSPAQRTSESPQLPPVEGSGIQTPADAARSTSGPRSIWQSAAVKRESSDADRSTRPAAATPREPIVLPGVPRERADSGAQEVGAPDTANESAAPGTAVSGQPAAEPATGDRPARKGRASIPSWDDILFGTRSDEDPA